MFWIFLIIEPHLNRLTLAIGNNISQPPRTPTKLVINCAENKKTLPSLSIGWFLPLSIRCICVSHRKFHSSKVAPFYSSFYPSTGQRSVNEQLVLLAKMETNLNNRKAHCRNLHPCSNVFFFSYFSCDLVATQPIKHHFSWIMFHITHITTRETMALIIFMDLDHSWDTWLVRKQADLNFVSTY